MDSVIQLAAQMGWPAAVALAVVGVAISVPIIVATISRNGLRATKIEADRKIEQTKIEVSVKNGAVALTSPKHHADE